MKKIKKVLLLCMLFMGVKAVNAQQNAQFSQYMFNGLYINPAYAGYKEHLYAHGFYRLQWAGINGAPQTYTLGIDGTTNDGKVGLGLIVANDKLGSQNSTSAMANYAYKIQTGEDSRISLGLAAGLLQYNIDGTRLAPWEQGDKNIPTDAVSVWLPDVNAGVYFSSERFYAGLSATNLVSSYVKIDADKRNFVPQQVPHFYLTAGGLFNLNESLKLKPSFLIKEELKGPTNVDLNAMLLINDQIWLGTSYRTGFTVGKNNLQKDLLKSDAIAFLAEVYAGERLRIGYSFDYDMTPLRSSHSGSHEISLGYYFTAPKVRIFSPRYF